MKYNETDFLETATQDALDGIARARELTRKYYNSNYKDTKERTSILRELLGSVGDNVAIDTPFYCDYGKNIFIGNDVIININCTFVDNQPIRIGNQVLIASNVQIYTSAHPTSPQERFIRDWREKGTTFFRTYALPVEVKDHVWIGGGSIILYDTFDSFELDDLVYLNVVDRHIEQSEVWEATLNVRAVEKPEGIQYI